MVSFLVVMLFMGSIIVGTNLIVTRRQVHRVLEAIVEQDGNLPAPASTTEEVTEAETDEDEPFLPDSRRFSLNDIFSADMSTTAPEFRYSTRYFAVLYDEDGNMESVKTNHIAAVAADEAKQYGELAIRKHFSFGSYGHYYYLVTDRIGGNGTIVIYLDSTSVITTNTRLIFTGLLLVFIGFILTSILVRYFSYRIIQPEIRNAEIQNRFITNASHELKTPLAVIKANTEVEQMLTGENEWNQSTMRQIDRLTGLIANLVMISRSQESRQDIERITIDAAKAVRETAETFRPVAEQAGKKLEVEVPEHLQMIADESQIRQLTSLLVDNAIKYCDDGGAVKVAISRRPRFVTLAVSNHYAEGKDVDYSRFFERFYRQDTSHNVDKGGYGIGLSIAESLVEQYHGTIDASWKDDIITFTCTLR